MRSCDRSYKVASVFLPAVAARASESLAAGSAMRIVIQRVKSSQVTVNGQVVGKWAGTELWHCQQ